ncbi:MAG: LCP family protein [Treponema sp.]|nr:LCP family protein [Treponema sp.]
MKLSAEKKGLLFLSLIVLFVVAAVVFIVVSMGTDSASAYFKKGQVIKTLVVIADNENNALSTDLLLYHPDSQKSALFNIPGNTGDIWESLDGEGGRTGRTDRVDTVYHEKGIEAYVEEISDLMLKRNKSGSNEIEFYLVIDLENLGKLTDLLGGLKVFVPSPVDYVNDEGERWLLPSGYLTLDGDKIKTYMEYSLPDEDDAEIDDRRQNAVVALISALHEQRDVIKEKKNFQFFSDKFETNVTQKVLRKLLEGISNINTETDRLVPQTLTGTLRTLPSSGQTLLFPLFEGDLIKDVVEQSLQSLETGGKGSYHYVVEVLNGSGLDKGSSKAIETLKELKNYDFLPPANADNSDYEHTVIISHLQMEDTDALTVLANFIQCKYIEHQPESTFGASRADFTVILGKDWNGRYVLGGYTGPEIETGDVESGLESDADFASSID